MNLIHSYKYKHFDDYMIKKEKWLADRESYIEHAGLKEFVDFNVVLGNLQTAMEAQYIKTNKNILQNKNPYLRFLKKGGYTVDTPKVEKDISGAVADLFPQDKYISLIEILETVNSHTNFNNAFEHYTLKYNREKPKDKVFYAGVIGYGCNIGAKRMSKISKGISEYVLDNTVNWYFSIDNLINANNKILTFIDSMALPKYFLKAQNKNHTASDGKKRWYVILSSK